LPASSEDDPIKFPLKLEQLSRTKNYNFLSSPYGSKVISINVSADFRSLDTSLK